MAKLTDVVIPALSETVTEGDVGEWLKQVGEYVELDESLVELETEKVTIELPSPVAGILREINPATTVSVGDVICKIEEGATPEAGASAPKTEEAKQEPAKAEATVAPSAPVAPVSSPAASHMSPAVSVAVQQHGVNPGSIMPTGPKGNLLKSDVLNFAAGNAPAALPPRAEDPREERVKMSKLRRVIAERLKSAQNTAAILSTFNEINMTPLLELRKKYKESFEKRHGIKLGMMSFFVKATVMALKELPAVNAEIYGNEIIYKNYYDIGIAVGSPRGLVVPVLRDADKLSFAEIEAKIADFGKRARDGKLGMEEMTGGTFTITNGGIFGSLLSTPIINPPQSGILGLHGIQKRPICNEKGDIVVADMMYIAHSYDHRIIDGREAVTFLVRIKQALEDPARLMLDV